jgi:hypothetical protein
MGERLRIRESRDVSASYGGWAIKAPDAGDRHGG